MARSDAMVVNALHQKLTHFLSDQLLAKSA